MKNNTVLIPLHIEKRIYFGLFSFRLLFCKFLCNNANKNEITNIKNAIKFVPIGFIITKN